jgi:sugar phosphate isomerase/epimerase
MRKIGINLEAIRGLTDEVYVKTIADLGFTATFSMAKDYGKMERLSALCAAHNIRFDTLHAPFDHINDIWLAGEGGDRMLAELKDCVDKCLVVGAPIAVVHLSAGEAAPPPTDMGRSRFIRLVEHAADKGVKVAFENQRKLANIAWAFEEFKDAPHVGFCWDCGHEGCFTPGRRYMPLFGHRLICTRIHDSDGVFNSDKHLLPFDGSLDFDYVAEALRGADPTVPLILELKRGAEIYEGMSDEEYLVRAAERIGRVRDMIGD